MNKQHFVNFLIGHNSGSFHVEKSGGMTVIKVLAKKLSDFNCDVYVLDEQYMTKKTKLIATEDIETLDKNKTICIYPEIIAGNPYGMKHIVRWILYHTTTEIENTWENSDEFFYFWENFQTQKKENKRILNCFDFKLDQCFIKNYDRDGVCHINKLNRPPLSEDIENKYNSIDLNTGYLTNNFSWLVEEFNKKEIFITEDDSTYFSVIAALCGCISIIITDKKINNLIPTHKYAISLNNEENKKNEIDLLRNNLNDLEKLSEKYLLNFFNFCEEKIL